MFIVIVYNGLYSGTNCTYVIIQQASCIETCEIITIFVVTFYFHIVHLNLPSKLEVNYAATEKSPIAVNAFDFSFSPGHPIQFNFTEKKIKCVLL